VQHQGEKGRKTKGSSIRTRGCSWKKKSNSHSASRRKDKSQSKEGTKKGGKPWGRPSENARKTKKIKSLGGGWDPCRSRFSNSTGRGDGKKKFRLDLGGTGGTARGSGRDRRVSLKGQPDPKVQHNKLSLRKYRWQECGDEKNHEKNRHAGTND